MALEHFMPFIQAKAKAKTPTKAVQLLPLNDQKALTKAFKMAAVALGFHGTPTYISDRSVFETPDIDLTRLTLAIDTDSYAKQAFSKYKELMWKEGWDIVSENSQATQYLWQRIDYMEIAMRRPFQDFLAEVLDQLVKYGNVFIAKSRGDLQEFFPGKLYPASNKAPIVGYYVIPTEYVEIQRDKNNVPKWYRQRTENSSFYSSDSVDGPKWNAKDVIHMSLDKRPGKAFGVPFLSAVMDDLVSFRQLEEDILNLVHRELFPLYKYHVGTEEHPADKDEIDAAALELEALRTEGGLVLPHRHDIDVIGAEGNVLDAEPYINHFKERIAIGLGLFPHHLGMSGSSGNRAMTDRLDIALYDKIKMIQKYAADCFRLFIFNEILFEGGFDPFITPYEEGESDRCVFRFNEIDVDTQVKKETHIIQKVTSNILTMPEGRLALGLDQVLDESETMSAMQVRLQPDQPVQTKTADGKPGQPKLVDTTPAAAKQASSTGGKPNLPNNSKGAKNIIRPVNQHGTRTSPNIRHDLNEELLSDIVELLENDEE